MKAIECKNISKKFGDKKALEDVSLSLQGGRIYALIGRNGAGKTTLMNCMCTKYLPDSGEVELLGERAYENEKVLSEICFLSDYMDVFELHSVKHLLRYAGRFYSRWNTEKMKEMLEHFEIKEETMYSALSKGQQTAVSIIIGICSGCKIVLFDEIYSGLDAVARKELYEMLMEEQENTGRTFVLSTHLIEEMAGLFTDVIMLHRGKILLEEDMESIHEKSFKCMGRVEDLQYFKGKNLISQKKMGTLCEYYLYDTLNLQERQKLADAGIQISAMTLQELFIAFCQ